MQRFKSIILPMQGQSKSKLHWLYDDVYSPYHPEAEKIFTYGNLRFRFEGTGYRNSEKLLLYVEIPADFMNGGIDMNMSLPTANYLLRVLSPAIDKLSREYVNKDKNIREKAQFTVQDAGVTVTRRNGITYHAERNCFVLRIHFNVPLVNALSVNAKATVRAIKDIMQHIELSIREINTELLSEAIAVYQRQQEIREYLKLNSLSAFIADGSILPRENGTELPMRGAVPFLSPDSMKVTIPLSDGTKLSGMAIKNGVTVITGGGYSGKSTLLDAIEAGIYDHIPGDGREYVITDNSALKIYAEDSRPVHNLDLSPFFKYLPGSDDLRDFTTPHASGSVSQAANIIEAVCGKTKLLLIDEDKSATNFMIRDRNMRKIVKREPIIPFTDRVQELYTVKGVSTILVIGGSSDYLLYADRVVLMEDYIVKDITQEIRSIGFTVQVSEEKYACWPDKRRILPRKTDKPFLYFTTVETENRKKIILDEYSADITLLTAITSDSQLNTLMHVSERLLTDKNADSEELLEKIEHVIQGILSDTGSGWYEQIRPIDAFCCINRMRGLRFYS